jgi:hypothetical protein
MISVLIFVRSVMRNHLSVLQEIMLSQSLDIGEVQMKTSLRYVLVKMIACKKYFYYLIPRGGIKGTLTSELGFCNNKTKGARCSECNDGYYKLGSN